MISLQTRRGGMIVVTMAEEMDVRSLIVGVGVPVGELEDFVIF